MVLQDPQASENAENSAHSLQRYTRAGLLKEDCCPPRGLSPRAHCRTANTLRSTTLNDPYRAVFERAEELDTQATSEYMRRVLGCDHSFVRDSWWQPYDELRWR